jgi:hypothetical protein
MINRIIPLAAFTWHPERSVLVGCWPDIKTVLAASTNDSSAMWESPFIVQGQDYSVPFKLRQDANGEIIHGHPPGFDHGYIYIVHEAAAPNLPAYIKKIRVWYFTRATVVPPLHTNIPDGMLTSTMLRSTSMLGLSPFRKPMIRMTDA